jgi:hypothetical protein
MTGNHDHTKVGYKRPPVPSRFPPGRSGNPAGRPKRQPGFHTVLLNELAAPAPGKGERGASNKLQALVRTLVDTAIAGNARAQAILIAAIARINDVEMGEPNSLTPEDREILDAYVGGELKRHTDKATAAGDD